MDKLEDLLVYLLLMTFVIGLFVYTEQFFATLNTSAWTGTATLAIPFIPILPYLLLIIGLVLPTIYFIQRQS